MEKKISVIVPVYNRENLILRCLDSIVNQISKPDEIIVVDNGSTDHTYNVIKIYIERNPIEINIRLISESRKGASRARQTGLENAIGEYVIFFDSDDEMSPVLIKRVREKLKETPVVDIICWKNRIHMLNGKTRIPPFNIKSPVENHLIHTLLRTLGYAVRKDFLMKAGGWVKTLNVWDDLELGLRLLLADPSIVGIKEILTEIYSQEESITGSNFSSKEGEWEFTLSEMEKENEKHDHPRKEKIRKILNYRKVILAAFYYRENNVEASRRLLKEALSPRSLKDKLLLKFSYHYTRKGLRGAWRIVGYPLISFR